MKNKVFLFIGIFLFILAGFARNISADCRLDYEYGYSAGVLTGKGDKKDGYACEPEKVYNFPSTKITLKAIQKKMKVEEKYYLDKGCFKKGFIDGYKDGYYGKSRKKMKYEWEPEKNKKRFNKVEEQLKIDEKLRNKAESRGSANDDEYPYSNNDRDPFSPLVDSYGKILIPKKIDIANLSLEGIIYSKKDPVAVINGEVLREQERIGDYIVLKVKRKEVILEKNNKTYALRLREGLNESSRSNNISQASCYDLGYKWGRCATLTLFGKECPPEDDFAVPVRCRDKEPTKRGIARGVESVYDQYNIPKH